MFCLARLGRHRNLIPGFPDSEVSKCEEPWRTPGRNVKAYHGRMEKTANAKKQHSDRAMEIINQLGEEYAAWFGWTSGLGRNVALCEYILEITESDHLHDEWLMTAREAFLKWKHDHCIDTTPPPNLRAQWRFRPASYAWQRRLGG
jgi:hypothetical protein